jgi:O-antigen ligase
MKGLIFTYLLAYGGSIVSLFSPFAGFLIYVAFGVLKPEALWFWSVPPGNYSRVIFVAFALSWFLNGLGEWRFGRAAPTLIALIAYWLWLLVGAITSPNQEGAWHTFEEISKIFLPCLMTITLIDSVDRLRQLAWVIALAHGYLALEFNLQYYEGAIYTNDWMFAGLDNNGIAITMVSALGLSFFLGITSQSWLARGAAFAAAALMAHVILFSMSRGGMLAMGVTGLVSFILIPKRPIYFAFVVIGALLVLRLAGPEVVQEFTTIFAADEERDASAESRITLTKDAIDCMLRHPVLGCGLENWGNIAPEYGWNKGKRVHNTWAEAGASLGVPGLLLILALYGSTVWGMIQLLRRLSQEQDPWIVGMARAVLAGLTGFIVSATFVTVDRVELPYYLILLGAGALKLAPAMSLATQQAAAVQSGLSPMAVESWQPSLASR